MEVEEIEKIQTPRFQEIEGNLIDLAYAGEFEAIGHGANCYKVMGAGIAGQIKQQIPEMFKADYIDLRVYYQRLGDYTIIEVPFDEEGNTFLGINIYSQLEPGANFDPIAFRLALRKINLLMPNVSIGLPLIGCGIGGGDWEEVKKIIQEELVDLYVTIVHFKN